MKTYHVSTLAVSSPCLRLCQQPPRPLPGPLRTCRWIWRRKAANAALGKCTADGQRVSVAVVDRSGATKVLLKADGSGPHTVSSSTGKAFTSASMVVRQPICPTSEGPS